MKTNDEKLNNFISKVQKDQEFVKLETFKNSILIIFDTSIFSDIYQDLKQLDNLALIYTYNNNLYLLIYKIKTYEVD